jgi:hypothetical protein
MNEAEWHTSRNPKAMLTFLRGRDCTSDRKLRLFAVAWCHLSCPELTEAPRWTGAGADIANKCHEDCRNALETAERFAEGFAGQQEMSAVHFRARDWTERWGLYDLRLYYQAAAAAGTTVAPGSPEVFLPPAQPYAPGPAGEAAHKTDRARQADLLRCLFGPLAFRPVVIPPSVLACKDRRTMTMARLIYERRQSRLLPLLADLLQEAGCTNSDVVDHCKSAGPHARGCWVVDLVLRKR